MPCHAMAFRAIPRLLLLYELLSEVLLSEVPAAIWAMHIWAFAQDSNS